ncbi:hypothetical protein FXO38_08714 [Capsicum annuum]|nr:hypothetical protein FXO38_08714 [Capsicum annuum]
MIIYINMSTATVWGERCDLHGYRCLIICFPVAGYGSCKYPGSGRRNGTFTNSSSLAPSSGSTASGCHPQYSHGVPTFLSSLIVGLTLWTAASL